MGNVFDLSEGRGMSKELSPDEVRSSFLRHVWVMIDYWEKEPRNPTARQKLEGLAHSILCALDGSAAALPAFCVAPVPHPDDKKFHQKEGGDWYPENHKAAEALKADISGSLHELLFRERIF